MTNGKLRHYYWQIYSFLIERQYLLDVTHEDYSFPDEDDVECRERLKALLVFRDGSRLFVRARLNTTMEVREYDYAYVYFDSQGKRIFQYDDAPHHPEIATHPHHVHKGERPIEGTDRAFPLDIPRVDFMTIIAKIERKHLPHLEQMVSSQ